MFDCLFNSLITIIDGRTPIPVVGLLVEGGVMAVDNVVQSLTQDLPVVICEGSGRAADMIARCYHQLSGNSYVFVSFYTFSKKIQFTLHLKSSSKPSEERLIESVAKQLQTMQASWRSRDEMIQALAKTIVKLCTEKRDLASVKCFESYLNQC